MTSPRSGALHISISNREISNRAEATTSLQGAGSPSIAASQTVSQLDLHSSIFTARSSQLDLHSSILSAAAAWVTYGDAAAAACSK